MIYYKILNLWADNIIDIVINLDQKLIYYNNYFNIIRSKNA